MTKAAMIVAALLFAGGDAAQAGEVTPYTLYRNSPFYPDLTQRVHIATFDAEERNAFESKTTNEANCETTRELFQAAAMSRPLGAGPCIRALFLARYPTRHPS